MKPLTWYQVFWSRLQSYLISPIGWPLRWKVIVYAAADRGKFLVANRYPRQIIGIGIRLPDMDPPMGSGRTRPYHPRLSIVWAKPHGASRWR